MKKALSIILCLSLLMSLVPTSVFAAPTMTATGSETADESFSAETTDKSATSDDKLAADGSVMPVDVYPSDGDIVDRRYPVVYYTFASDVVIDPANVTVEKINNANVGGVYFDQEENSIWVFPANPQQTVFNSNKVAYTAWTSNIAAEDGSLLYFPGVSFTLTTEMPSDGENLVPFGNMEYGWSPFSLSGNADAFSLVEDPKNPANHVTLRSWPLGTSKWPHSQVDVAWKPGTTYKVSGRVMVKNFVDDAGNALASGGPITITPDLVYTVPSFDCKGTTGQGIHDGQTGTTCTVCSSPVDREHSTSFSDHTVEAEAPKVSVTGGVSNGWQSFSFERTIRNNIDITKSRKFSIYSNPYSNNATEFYIDDVAIYEKVATSFGAGRNSVLKAGVTAPEAIYGYNGDSIGLPDASAYFDSTKAGYIVDGWTDGTDVYTEGFASVKGQRTLTPNVVPAGEAYTVNFAIDDDFADCYEGPAKAVIAVGETLDLTSSEFALGSVVGFMAEGWRNTATGEMVTSVSGTVDEIINLEAVYTVKSAIVFDSEAKLGEVTIGNATAVYDDSIKAITVTPSSRRDPMVTFDGLSLSTNDYSYVDVTYINNDTLESKSAGEVYFVVTGITKPTGGYNAKAFLLSQDGDVVTYRYELSANTRWQGVCSSIRIDPYDDSPAFSVKSIAFVKDEAVDTVEITGLEAPELSKTPDTEADRPLDAPYSVESVVWSPECEYFAGATEYTVTITAKITQSGYMFDETTTATVGGVPAEVSVNPSNSNIATITYTYDATEAAKPVVVTMTNAPVITTNNGTLALYATVEPANAGDVIVPDTVKWSITGGDEGIAELNGNVLTAIWDGSVVVTATPDYDAEQAASFEITISGQIGYDVTYDSCTGATVNNMPANDRAKKNFTVSSVVPTRRGYTFEGWTLVPGADETFKNIEVDSDITLYAKWGKGGYIADFNKAGDRLEANGVVVSLADGNIVEVHHGEDNVLDTENSEFISTIADNDFYIRMSGRNTTAIPVDAVKKVVIGFRTDAAGPMGCSMYFATKNASGAWIGAPYEENPDDYLANQIKNVYYTAPGDVNKLCEIEIDPTVMEDWQGYLHHLRFDIDNCSSFIGNKFYLDYIKLVGASSVESFELNVTEPAAAAEVYDIDAVTFDSDKFEVTSITWDGPELIDGKYFAGGSAYTATIKLKATAGNVLSDAPAFATVNGNDAEVTSDGTTATVVYSFPETETLVDFTLMLRVAGGAAAEITESLGTLQLEKRVYASAGVVVPNSNVYWSIDESQKKYGWVDENGLVTGNTDCDELIVTATSKYNPSVKASISIKVSGQIPESNVYFEAGTGEAVSNLPAASTAKGEYVLPMDVIPTRTNYAFKGWSKEIGGEIIKVDDVSEDTTYYAVWGYSKGEDFNGTSLFQTTNGIGSTTFEDGVVIFTPTNGNVNEGVHLQQGGGVFGARNRILTSDIEYVEIKTNLAPENLELCIYVQTSDRTGGSPTTWNEAANSRFYSNNKEIANKPEQNIFKYCEQDGDWYIYKIPSSLLKNWTNYLNQIRFNFIQRDMEDTGLAYLPYPAGTQVKFDYIRFVGKDIPAMDIVDVTEPKTKGEATTDVTVVQNDAFKVTNVTWSPALLSGLFFGSDTAYTVTMDVEIHEGYYAFSNPPARVSVNGNDAVFTRTNNTSGTISYTFPKTDYVENLKLVTIELHEKTSSGAVTITKQIFSGDDFDLNKFVPENSPAGYRWSGWSTEEGGEPISESINITEDAEFYALYEQITEFDFTNEYHTKETNVKAENGTVEFDGTWAVVTPESNTANAALKLYNLSLSGTTYDYVEVIYDGTLEDETGKNQFDEAFAPVLKVYDALGMNVEAAIVKAEPVVTSHKVSYRYTYDLVANGRASTITAVDLAPYTGFPAWGVASVKFIENTPIEEEPEISGIDVPVTWAMPDTDATVNEHYILDNITWSAREGFNSDDSFKSEVAYTVAVTVKPETGYKITQRTAILNGETISGRGGVTLNSDGTMTVKKTFDKTLALIPFTLEVEDAAITTPDGTVQMVAKITPSTIPVTDVTWSIVSNGPEGKSATINAETGVVKASYDGDVVVVATSKYNPTVSATATVRISGQIPYYNVKFDANTTANVTNMPADVQIKGEYQLPTQLPVREGFTFAGWRKNPSDVVTITKDVVTSDTTYYALWVTGISHEFITANPVIDVHSQMSEATYDTAEGTFSFLLTGTDPQIYFGNGSPLFSGNDIRTVQIRIKTDKSATFDYGMYFESVDSNDNIVGPSYSANPDRYVANFTHAKYTTTPDDYTLITFDMSGKSDWVDGYPSKIRLDIPNDGTQASVGIRYIIDYIRMVNYEATSIAVSGIETPVAGKQVDLTATSEDSSKYTVTNVSWEEDLLYDTYYDSMTAYTVNVTVKGVPGWFASDSPTSVKVNGNVAEVKDYNYETGELTIKYTFAETGDISSRDGYNITLVSLNDDFDYEEDIRTILKNDTFALAAAQPKATPAGYRWLGWATSEDAETADAPESFVVTGDVTFYAIYEALTEFDYSNPYHQAGTTSKMGASGIRFENDLAIISVPSSDAEPGLVTPVMNIDGSEYDVVEVYYSAHHDSVHNKVHYENRFSTVRNPVIKYNTMDDRSTFNEGATLIGIEKVTLEDYNEYYKYTYDMSTSANWHKDIASIQLSAYSGYPEWGVRLIKLVPNEVIYDTADIRVREPEALYTVDIADNFRINDKYEIVSVDYAPTPENGVYAPETEYTVLVTYRPVCGYTVGIANATVNKEYAEVTDNGNDTYTARYTFEETNALYELEVSIEGNDTIMDAGRYIQLEAIVEATDGSELPDTSVIWTLENEDGSDNEYAKITPDGGRVYPLSNGTVIVTATSNYNPEYSATHVIEISGQKELCTVTFDKNTDDDVEMPEPVKVVGNFVPEEYDIKREGYFFLGWSTDEDAINPTASFNITEDTTLYAKWGKGYEWSFDNEATSIRPYGDRITTYENGIATIAPNKIPAGQVVVNSDNLGNLGLETFKHPEIQIRFSIPKISQLKWYLQSIHTDMKTKSPWSEAAAITVYNFPANKPGEFQTASFNLANHPTWNQYRYVQQIRLDMGMIAPTETIQIDWIRLLTYERDVKFDGNGGLIPFGNDGDGVYEMTETHDIGKIQLPADPVREGYKFVGWAKKTEDYNKIYTGTFNVTDNVTLYAIWSPSANLNETTVGTLEDEVEVTANANGTVSLGSSGKDTATPVVFVADTMDVGENDTLVITSRFAYDKLVTDEITLSYVPEGETEPVVVTVAADLGKSSNGTKVVVANLADQPGFSGTVSDVVVILQEGKLKSYTVESVLFTNEDVAEVLVEAAKKKSPNFITVTAVKGIQSKRYTPKVFPTVSGNSGVSESAPSTTTSPTAKPKPKPSATGGSGSSGTNPATPATPANTSKFAETQKYTAGKFVDVSASDWFYADVAKSYNLGLMNGKSETEFVPEGTVTLAEAITVAARMNAIYNGKTIPAAAAGEMWYTPYVTYATSNNVVTAGQYADYNALATRTDVANMFVRALPATWYEAINMFVSIPDVPNTDASYNSIVKLYNAGIITGIDEAYNFAPAANIKRSEMSAIINRVAIKESRQRVVTEAEKANNIKIIDAAYLIANGTVGNCVEKTFVEKDGLAYAMASKNDPIVNDLHRMTGGETIDANTFKTITVVLKTSDMSKVPAGHVAKIYFMTATAELSEANTVRTSWPSKANADGTVTLTFKMSHDSWTGDVTLARFDPFDLVADFSIVSITFAP